jgi:hypothetical protein
MKKRLHLIFLPAAALILFAIVFGLSGCKSAMERYDPVVSELRDNIYLAESDRFSVSVITGKREDPFLMDGHAGGTRAFTLITIVPKSGAGPFTYKATVNGKEYTGDLLPHPFAPSFSADIEVLSTDSAIPVTVSGGGTEETLTAVSVKNDRMITADKAIEIAEKRLKTRVDGFKSNGTYRCEVYVRLLQNPIDNSGGYHWYVAFIGENHTIYAVLIDPESMEIVAIRD